MAFNLRCHHCSHWMGESDDPVEFVGLFKDPRDRANVEEPRSSWRCRACGWVNVFRKAAAAWRQVEMKSRGHPVAAEG